MKQAFYKNWKKMALALTSVFWASCGDESPVTAPAPAPESSAAIVPESSSEASVFSSSETDNRINCVEAEITKEINGQSYSFDGLACEDGEEFEHLSICPDYGVPALPCDETYINKNKKHFSAEEFSKIYKIAKEPISTSSSSAIADESSSSLTIVAPAYGVFNPNNNDDPIAAPLYGAPCVFNGTCDEEK